MNKKQRDIIVMYYEDFLENCMRGDPVSNSNLLGELFSSLGKEDEKLKIELEQTLEETDDE